MLTTTDLTDTDLSRLVTLVVIHDGESSSMREESANRLALAGLLTVSGEDDDLPCGFTIVTDSGRALVARILEVSRDDGKCGDCPEGPGGGKRYTFSTRCHDCKRFYGDLKVKP
jgi:hypothetical protein